MDEIEEIGFRSYFPQKEIKWYNFWHNYGIVELNTVHTRDNGSVEEALIEKRNGKYYSGLMWITSNIYCFFIIKYDFVIATNRLRIPSLHIFPFQLPNSHNIIFNRFAVKRKIYVPLGSFAVSSLQDTK